MTDRPAAGELKPLALWHDDDGEVLWWVFPIREAPWIGSPLSTTWPGYHTHFTPLPEPPEAPDEVLVSRKALLAIADEVESQYCKHDVEVFRDPDIDISTCFSCGKTWHDSDGGFQPYKPPAFVTKLRDLADPDRALRQTIDRAANARLKAFLKRKAS